MKNLSLNKRKDITVSIICSQGFFCTYFLYYFVTYVILLYSNKKENHKKLMKEEWSKLNITLD